MLRPSVAVLRPSVVVLRPDVAVLRPSVAVLRPDVAVLRPPCAATKRPASRSASANRAQGRFANRPYFAALRAGRASATPQRLGQPRL